jgi:hypothetical protein
LHFQPTFPNFEKWELTEENEKRLHELEIDEDLAKTCMLPSRTHIISEKKLLLNYLNNTLESEIKRVLKYNYKDMKAHFLNISEKQCQTLNNIHVVWGDFISYYEEETDPKSD